ncbi:MAG: porin [Burkholderiales bacterium]|nr:porin [Burkholderiales bacterium]
MKKTLLAIAALAATSGAFAQSVTLYGVLDASVESVKGGSTTTRLSSDNLSSSRVGVKGSEDLGDGMHANFALETNVKVDTGAQGNTARFFDRAAWLGLQGGFGEVRVGRIDSSIGDIAGNVLSAQAYDDFKIANTRAGNAYRRVDNSITYYLPTFLQGLSAQLQYATAAAGFKTTGGIDTAVAGTEAAGVDAGKSYGMSVKYVAGPFSAGLGYLSAKDEQTQLAGNQKGNAALLYAGYDFGVVKLTGYYDSETSLASANTALVAGTNSKRFQLYGAKLAVPFSTKFVLTTSLSKGKHVNGLDADNNVTFVSVKGVYELSKRTSLYGMVGYIDNSAQSNLVVAAAPGTAVLDKNSHGIAFGIRHAF